MRLKEENGERMRIEKALAEVNKKLHLMTNITRHDLLNQLSAMRGYLELADLVWDTEPAKARANMRNAGNVIKRTTNTISFAAEYQKIGMKTPVWKDIRSLVEVSA
jgi:hypothetical protein